MIVYTQLIHKMLYWGEVVAVRVTIGNDKLGNFSNEAQDTLKNQLEKYADEIISEASLIEEGLREDNASTEITSNYVLWAVRKNKTSRPKKKSKKMVVIKITAFISSLITGALFDIEAIQASVLRLILFLVVFAIAGGTTLIQFFEEERE